MIWHFVLSPSTVATERHSCADLLTHPELYAGNGLIRHFVTHPSKHCLALNAISLETMILLIGYQEHRDVFWFSEEDHFRRLETTRDELLFETDRPGEPWQYWRNPPNQLTADQYAWLLEQNREISDWIRRKLNAIIQGNLRPSMLWAQADLLGEAKRVGLPTQIFVVPFFERAHAPSPHGEQLALL